MLTRDRWMPAAPASKAMAATAEIMRIFMLNLHPVEADENVPPAPAI